MAVADVFDALVSRRPYKDSFSIDKSYSIIEEENGRSFDPRIVECFVSIRPKIEKIVESFKNEMKESKFLGENVIN